MGRPMNPDSTSASTSSQGQEVHTIHTSDRRNAAHRIKHPPTVHVAYGFEEHLPFLRSDRPLICISDWQYEPATQRHFWQQAFRTLCGALG